MEERKNTGSVGNPKELTGDEWGEGECTGQHGKEEGESAADVDIT